MSPTVSQMVKAASPSKAIKKLVRELDTAETFARDALDDYTGSIPATLLVIFKQRHEHPPQDYSLYDPDNLELSIMADIRSNLRAAGFEVASQSGTTPRYALSMIEIPGKEQDFWLKKGFFPADRLPASFIGQDTLLITASNRAGRVLRRLIRIVDARLLLTSSSRQLGRSVQIEESEQPTEMTLFWQPYGYGA